MSTDIAAHIFSGLIAYVVLFQIALVAGLPWGNVAWGGTFPGRLPLRMRVASGVSILLLIALGLVVEIRAGALLAEWQPLSRTLVWGVVAYSALGIVANSITPSRWERILWVPVTALMLLLSLVVATGS